MARSVSILILGAIVLLLCSSLSLAVSSTSTEQNTGDNEHSKHPVSEITAPSVSTTASTTKAVSGQTSTTTVPSTTVKVINGTTEAPKNSTKSDDCGFFCKLFN